MQETADGTSISRIGRAVYSNRGKAGTTFIATLAITVALITLVPRKYGSEAVLFVRLGRETVSLDPTATTGSTISVYESRENEINSVRDMLQSRAILERTVDKLGAEVVLGEALIATPSAEQTVRESTPEDSLSIVASNGLFAMERIRANFVALCASVHGRRDRADRGSVFHCRTSDRHFHASQFCRRDRRAGVVGRRRKYTTTDGIRRVGGVRRVRSGIWPQDEVPVERHHGICPGVCCLGRRKMTRHR